MLHRVPASSVNVASLQAFFEPRLAGKVTLAPILIDQAPLFQILVVCILSTKHEFQVDIVVELSIHRAFEANRLRAVACNLLQALVTFDFNPTSCSQGSPHRWVPNRHAEVLLALLWHKCLVKWLRLRCSRTRVFLLYHILVAIVTTIVIAIEPFIDAAIIEIVYNCHTVLSFVRHLCHMLVVEGC